MGREPLVRTVGRTAVVASWLLVLAVAGRPAWAGVLLGAVLVLVWAAPYLVTDRHPRKHPAAGPGQGTPPP
jgi:hypothetical protein